MEWPATKATFAAHGFASAQPKILVICSFGEMLPLEEGNYFD